MEAILIVSFVFVELLACIVVARTLYLLGEES
jgi:hypothetical protein